MTVNEALSSYELSGLTGYSYYIINFAFYTLAGVGKWTEIVVETVEDGRYSDVACLVIVVLVE